MDGTFVDAAYTFYNGAICFKCTREAHLRAHPTTVIKQVKLGYVRHIEVQYYFFFVGKHVHNSTKLNQITYVTIKAHYILLG